MLNGSQGLQRYRHSKALPVPSITLRAGEDFTLDACLSRFPKLFFVTLKCQKLFYLRNLHQPKKRQPISKVGPFNKGKFFFFYRYLKLVGSREKSCISAVKVLLIAIITCRLQFLLKGFSNEQIQRKKRNTSGFIVNDYLGLESSKAKVRDPDIHCELTNHRQRNPCSLLGQGQCTHPLAQ